MVPTQRHTHYRMFSGMVADCQWSHCGYPIGIYASIPPKLPEALPPKPISENILKTARFPDNGVCLIYSELADLGAKRAPQGADPLLGDPIFVISGLGHQDGDV